MNKLARNLLFDDRFEQKLHDFLTLFDPVCELINTCQKVNTSVADAVDLWLNLQTPEKFSQVQLEIENRRNMALNLYALCAYSLHPHYMILAPIKLSAEQQRMVQNFLIDELTANGLKELAEFRDKKGFFVKLYDKNITDPIVFWMSAKVHYSELSSLALKLLKVPASSAAIERLFSQWSFVHNKLRNRLSLNVSKKLLHIYYSLKLKDQNICDDY